jgi:hypothetical protein
MGRDRLGPRADVRAALGCVAGIERDEARILHPAIGILEALGELGLKNAVVQPAHGGSGQAFAAAEMVVEKQAEPQQPSRAQAGVMRQHEAQRPDDMRRYAPQHLALLQSLAHQTEFVMLQIAQPAMHQLG